MLGTPIVTKSAVSLNIIQKPSPFIWNILVAFFLTDCVKNVCCDKKNHQNKA